MNRKMHMILSQIRKLSILPRNKQKNHYDSLGLAKSATQADVKSAYYELSKVYHPDRNHGHTQQQRDAHSQKFRDITEAYEILGNVKTRKLYDKGFLGLSTEGFKDTAPEDPLHKFYQSREVRHKAPKNSKETIYNFDEWSKVHYGDTFKRNQEFRRRHETRRQSMKENIETEKHTTFLVILGALIFFCALYKDLSIYDVSTANVKRDGDS